MPKISKRGQKRQSSKPEMKYLRTYIYVRLSERDGGHGRRDSIYIQKQICEDYAKKHPEMLVVKVYADAPDIIGLMQNPTKRASL